jgi:hypothetical protein
MTGEEHRSRSVREPQRMVRQCADAKDARGANGFRHSIAKLGRFHPPHAASCFVAYLSSGGAPKLRAGAVPTSCPGPKLAIASGA